MKLLLSRKIFKLYFNTGRGVGNFLSVYIQSCANCQCGKNKTSHVFCLFTFFFIEHCSNTVKSEIKVFVSVII